MLNKFNHKDISEPYIMAVKLKNYDWCLLFKKQK